MSKIFFSFYSALLLVAIPSSRAQAVEPNGVTFRAVVCNRDLPDLAYDEQGKPVSIPLYRGRMTSPQIYTGGDVIAFYSTTKASGGQSATDAMPIVQIHLNPSIKKTLIVLWMAKDQTYAATALPDENDRLKGGQVYFVNFADKELAINCNREIKILPPGAGYVTEAKNGGVGLEIAMRLRDAGGDWKLALTNGIRVRRNECMTIFIVNPAEMAPALTGVHMLVAQKQPALDLFVISDPVAPPTMVSGPSADAAAAR